MRSSLQQRIVAGILGATVLLVIFGGRARRAAILPPQPSDPITADLPPAPREVSVRPLPGVNDPPRGTPTIDLLATLAVRRRIAREGFRVYLSEMFAETDSTVVRWPDRTSRTYSVFFSADTTIRGWSKALVDEARRGMGLWNGNSAGITLTETEDPKDADIVVSWTEKMPNARQAGNTNLQWGGDGLITKANVTLGIFFTDSVPLTPTELRRTAGHEFGHALGLPHSTEPEDFMFARTEVDAPSRRDQATLLLLYAVPGGSLKVSGER